MSKGSRLVIIIIFTHTATFIASLALETDNDGVRVVPGFILEGVNPHSQILNVVRSTKSADNKRDRILRACDVCNSSYTAVGVS